MTATTVQGILYGQLVACRSNFDGSICFGKLYRHQDPEKVHVNCGVADRPARIANVELTPLASDEEAAEFFTPKMGVTIRKYGNDYRGQVVSVGKVNLRVVFETRGKVEKVTTVRATTAVRTA
jgi:hypothetical protein